MDGPLLTCKQLTPPSPHSHIRSRADMTSLASQWKQDVIFSKTKQKIFKQMYEK